MLKVDPKTTNLAILQNFDEIEKMNAGFGISDPKLIIIMFDQFRIKYIFAVDECNRPMMQPISEYGLIKIHFRSSKIYNNKNA